MTAQEKALIFCQIPGVANFLLAVLDILNINAASLDSFQDQFARQAIVDEFNTAGSKLRILIVPYPLAGFGLNLQKDCWACHAIETAWNLANLEQVVGRIRRFKNPKKVVYLYGYMIPDTYDDRAVKRDIEKALPQAIAQPDRQIFTSSAKAADGSGTADICDWVMKDGQLWRSEEAMKRFGPCPVLSHEELLREILKGAKSQIIQAS